MDEWSGDELSMDEWSGDQWSGDQWSGDQWSGDELSVCELTEYRFQHPITTLLAFHLCITVNLASWRSQCWTIVVNKTKKQASDKYS